MPIFKPWHNVFPRRQPPLQLPRQYRWSPSVPSGEEYQHRCEASHFPSMEMGRLRSDLPPGPPSHLRLRPAVALTKVRDRAKPVHLLIVLALVLRLPPNRQVPRPKLLRLPRHHHRQKMRGSPQRIELP